jgi:hypothetical protein
MDGLRQKLAVSESPEDREKRQKQLILPNILSLSISVAMVIIGYQVSVCWYEVCSGRAIDS